MAPDVFLSYAREDISKARELVRILEQEGWDVWWDKEITPGRDFELEIDQALANAKAVLVLWSSNSVASNWVRNEAKEAKEANKLVPVLLDDSRIPLSFRSLSTIELPNWPEKQSLIEIESIKTALRRVAQDEAPIQSLQQNGQSDEMTLSVRVATRVAEMVNEEKTLKGRVEYLQLRLAVEECIGDLCLALVTREYSAEELKKLDVFKSLSQILGNADIFYTQVCYAQSTILDSGALVGELDKPTTELLTQLVNNFESEDEHQLMTESHQATHAPLILCLPLPKVQNQRLITWIMQPDIPDGAINDIQSNLFRKAKLLEATGSAT